MNTENKEGWSKLFCTNSYVEDPSNQSCRQINSRNYSSNRVGKLVLIHVPAIKFTLFTRVTNFRHA